MGNENETLASCTHPACMKTYQEFLQRQYRSIGALNASWGTSFESFDKVGLSKPDDNYEKTALKEKNYPRWFDRKAFQSWNFANYCKKFGDAARRIDPQAISGPEGTGSLDDDLGLIVRNTNWTILYSMPAADMAWRWAIPTYGWVSVGLGVGGILGLGLSMLMLKLGLIRRSFADAEQWEQEHRKANGLPPLEPLDGGDGEEEDDGETETGQWRPTPGWLRGPLVITTTVLLCAVIGGFVARFLGHAPGIGVLIGAAVGPIAAGLPLRLLVPSAKVADDDDPSDAEVWIAYPHARREMVKEMAFLAPPVLGAWIGVLVASGFEGFPPLWLEVLGGVLLGYLVGGGVVWAVRLFGSRVRGLAGSRRLAVN